jgi:hypothetical protein
MPVQLLSIGAMHGRLVPYNICAFCHYFRFNTDFPESHDTSVFKQACRKIPYGNEIDAEGPCSNNNLNDIVNPSHRMAMDAIA